jgi:hypothetical protein
MEDTTSNKPQNSENNASSSLLQQNNRPRKTSSSDNCRAPSLTKSQKIEWLKHNLPVIVQPQCDIDNGYPLVGVFVCFEEATSLHDGPYRVHLKIVYEVSSFAKLSLFFEALGNREKRVMIEDLRIKSRQTSSERFCIARSTI